METLTLEQAYYVGELISALIVVISIIYLAVQVRQNTKAIRLSNYQSVSASWTPTLDLIAGSEQVADIYKRGLHTFDTLSEIEQVRFRALAAHMLRIINEPYEQMLEGAMRKGVWDGFRRTIIDLMHTSGMQVVWSYRKHWYSKDFQNFIDDIIEHHAGEAKPVASAPKD